MLLYRSCTYYVSVPSGGVPRPCHFGRRAHPMACWSRDVRFFCSACTQASRQRSTCLCVCVCVCVCACVRVRACVYYYITIIILLKRLQRPTCVFLCVCIITYKQVFSDLVSVLFHYYHYVIIVPTTHQQDISSSLLSTHEESTNTPIRPASGPGVWYSPSTPTDFDACLPVTKKEILQRQCPSIYLLYKATVLRPFFFSLLWKCL
jgi:hypothetical protein